MGMNSTEVAYGFGQLGSGHVDTTSEFKPPTGRVVVSIQMIDDASFTKLTPDTAQDPETSFAGTATVTAGNGTNSVAIASTQVFPAGMSIFGRWTCVQLAAANSAGGVICYFGE